MAYITLLSDFGLQDASVAIAKGILMQYLPSATFVDISHEVEPFNKKQAAYLLGATYNHFPAGSFHIPLVDIFAGKNPSLVMSLVDDHFFLAADNGIIPLAMPTNNIQSWRCIELGTQSHSFPAWLHKCGETIQRLQTTKPENLGYPSHELRVLAATEQTNQNIACEVIHIDLFGNVVLDINRSQLGEAPITSNNFSLRFIQYEEIKEISANFSDVREGYKLCRFNSHGQLEICVNKGNAANLFGLRMGSKHNNIQLTIK